MVVSRRDVLTAVVKLHNYEDMFLPDALRKFFSLIPAPNERGQFLENLLNLFSQQYLVCNPDLQMSTGKQASVVSCSKCVLITGAPLYSPSIPPLTDTVFVICYSLILLSVDLTSPHVKNKMSKREFIRNLRQATPDVSNELLGHMYDNIYLSGHVATEYS